jgi:hypothetical protein
VTLHAALLLSSLSLLACNVDSDGTSPLRPDEHDEPEQDSDVLAAPAPPRLAAAGWIELADSPIVPWCAAVLIAPDVAITHASCVAAYDAGFLQVGFGEVGVAELVDVDAVELQKDAAAPELALAALALAEPVVGVDPVELALTTGRNTICGVRSVSYTYVLAGEASPRWSWSGCVGPQEPRWIQADTGAPNCHGDLGAGAFLRDGSLLGVVVDARSDGECVRDERIATVDANEAFFDRALELSRP